MSLNPRDQNKWNSLQDEGGGVIDNILSGKGTDQDFKSLSRILNDQHQLAGKIFDQGLIDAENTTATIVDRMNRERQDSGKRPLTQKAFDRVFSSTLSNVMSQALEDILGMIHDEFATQDEQVKKRLDQAFERIRNFTSAQPRPSVQTQGVQGQETAGSETIAAEPQAARSLLDRFIERNGRAPESAETSEPRRRSLLDRFLRRSDQAETSRTSVLQMIRDAAVNVKDKVTGLYSRFRNRNAEDDEDRRAAIWTRRLKAMFDPLRNFYNKGKKAASKFADIVGMIGKPLLLALMSPMLIKAITDAVGQYLNFDSISKFLSSTWESTKQMGSSAIDWVWTKVKSFLGLGQDEKKKNVTKTKSPDPLKQNTSSASLPKAISPEQARKELPRYTQGLEAAKKQLVDAQTAYKQNPSEANKKRVEDAQRNLSFYQTRVTQYSQRADEDKAMSGASASTSMQAKTAENSMDSAPISAAPKTAGNSVDSAASFVSPVQPTQGVNSGAETGVNPPKTTTSLTGPDPSTVTQNSSVKPKTQVVADLPKFEPGKTVDSETSRTEEKTEVKGRGGVVAQIGIGSFSFDSNDSALNILNLGMLS